MASKNDRTHSYKNAQGTDTVHIECCVALEPSNETLKEILLTASESFSCCADQPVKTLVQIDDGREKLGVAPHLTLYQLAIPVDNVNSACDSLRRIAARHNPVNTTTSTLDLNHREKDSVPIAVEIMYEKLSQQSSTANLLGLQSSVVTTLNPLRNGHLIERDPTRRLVSDMFLDNVNVIEFGWSEGIEHFNPHLTLGWVGPDSHIAEPKFKGGSTHTFDTLTLFALGSHGTCVQKLYSCPLLANAAPANEAPKY